MAIEGVDYAWARPSPAGLYAAGKRFAARYLYGSTAGKALTKSELDALHAAGLDVVLIWEQQAAEAKGGYAAGQDRARRAADCVRSLGAPADTAVYFCVDYDETQLSRARDYFRGVTSVWPHGRTGIYAGQRVIQAAKDQGWCRWLWQTYAWSGGVWVPGAHLQQYRNGVTVAGGDVDLCRAMTAQFGQWNAGGDDMLSRDDVRTLATTDGVFAAPPTAHDRATNPHWTLGSHVTEQTRVGHLALAGVSRLEAAVALALGRPLPNSAEIVRGVLAGLDPAGIAAAVVAALPAGQAQQVVNELAARLDKAAAS